MKAEVTENLRKWNRGETKALDEVMGLLVDELRQLAAAYLRRERADHTLQPTALVNELYLRLAEREEVAWQDRAHFFAFAATQMRRILVDHARHHRANKRGGDQVEVTLDEWAAFSSQPSVDMLDLDRALEALAAQDERLVKVVELYFFGGLTVEEVAEVLDIGSATVKRDLRAAKAFLLHRMKRQAGEA
jgi:RNA polymerase sigma-70 factor, ECF subfamily